MRGRRVRAGAGRAGRAARFAGPALVGAALLFALAPAGPAAAHNSVVGTAPVAGASVVEQPGEVSLTTSDVLIEVGGGNSIDVIGPDGRHYATECAAVDATTAWAPVQLGAAGEYTVRWRLVSADGHPISGEFAFAWAPADGQEFAEGSAEPACADLLAETPPPPGSSGEEGEDGGADASAGQLPVDLLWIGAAAVLVLAAGVVTWVVARRERDDGDDGDGSDPGVGGGR